MKKILLDQPILDIKGKPMADRVIQDAEGQVTKTKRTLREDLLDYLGSNLPEDVITSGKDTTWIWNITNQLNDKGKEIEITDEKLEFLKKLLIRNAIVIPTRDQKSGQIVKEEIKRFTPFEVGQMLSMLGEKE